MQNDTERATREVFNLVIKELKELAARFGGDETAICRHSVLYYEVRARDTAPGFYCLDRNLSDCPPSYKLTALQHDPREPYTGEGYFPRTVGGSFGDGMQWHDAIKLAHRAITRDYLDSNNLMMAENITPEKVMESIRPDYIGDWGAVPKDADYIVHTQNSADEPTSFATYPGRTFERQYFQLGVGAQVVARVWEDQHARRIAINPEIPPAFAWMRDRLEQWMVEGKQWADILVYLGLRHFAWTGPAMRKNRQAALAALLNRKVKASEAGITLLVDTIMEKIGARGNCLARRYGEVETFMRVAAVVTGYGV